MATIVNYIKTVSPKQSAIVDDIRRKIASRSLTPGSKLASISRLAAEYDVSLKTAQRAIRHLVDSGHVITRARSGTYVAEFPPTLSNIAVVFTKRPLKGQWPQMLHAWRLECERLTGIHAERNRELRFAFFYLDPEVSRGEDYSRLVDGVKSHEFAGMIFPWQPDPAYLEAFAAPDLYHVVMTGRDYTKPFFDLRCVKGNVNILATQIPLARGLDFLQAEGCRRIAFLNISKLNPAELLTDEIIRETRSRGMTTDHHLIQAIDDRYPDWSANCIALLARQFRRERVDGLFITDDNIITHATAELKKKGLDIPQDLLVLAMANFPHLPPASVPSRYVGYDVRGLVRRAVDIIFSRQENQQIPREMPVDMYMDDELPYELDRTTGSGDGMEESQVSETAEAFMLR